MSTTPMSYVPDAIANTHFTLISVGTLNNAVPNAPVVEVACVRLRDGNVQERWHSLVKPGGHSHDTLETALPEAFIQRTGLYPSVLENQPELEEILPLIATFVGRDMIVWTNPPGKSNAVYRHFRLTQPRDKQISLLSLATKALPALPQHSLSALARHYGIENNQPYRANSQVQMAAQIFARLLVDLAQQQSIHTMSQLLDFCPAVNPARHRTRDNLAFDRNQLKTAPTQPGVYFMKNRTGDILYIGKAKNLRNRLRSYFQKQSRLPDKIAAMMKQVTSIDIHVVGSELEALLLEAELIKTHQPFFNKKIKDFQRMVYMKVSVADEFPWITSAHEPEDTQALYFGPFAGKSILQYKLEILNRVFKLRDCSEQKFARHRQSPCMQYHLGLCSGPCAGLISPTQYQESVEDFIHYLEQQPSQAVAELIAKRDSYAAALQFEKAAALQNHLNMLEQLQLKSYELLYAIEAHHCLLVLPHSTPNAYRILTVIQGQPQAWHTYDPAQDDSQTLHTIVNTALEAVQSIEESSNRPPIAKNRFEEARLISQWLRTSTETEGQVVFFQRKSREQILRELQLYLSPVSELPNIAENPEEEDTWAWQQFLDGTSDV